MSSGYHFTEIECQAQKESYGAADSHISLYALAILLLFLVLTPALFSIS